MQTKEGTIEFRLSHEHADWRTDSNGYKFGPFKGGGYEITAAKTPKGELRIAITSSNLAHVFRGPIPTDFNKRNSVFVAFTWSPQTIILYLNGKSVLEKPTTS